jgi:hypothetical protein
LISTIGSDRAQIAAQAASAAEVADRVAQSVAAAKFDQASTARLLKSISGDADYISVQGERAAEQGAMALDSLFVAYARNTKVGNEPQVRAAVQALFQQLNDPSSYNAFKFAQQMRAVNALLP